MESLLTYVVLWGHKMLPYNPARQNKLADIKFIKEKGKIYQTRVCDSS